MALCHSCMTRRPQLDGTLGKANGRPTAKVRWYPHPVLTYVANHKRRDRRGRRCGPEQWA